MNNELVEIFCNLGKLRLRLYPTTFTPAQYEEWISQARNYLQRQNPLLKAKSSGKLKKIQPEL